MSTPQLGAGTCTFSNGAQYQVHIGSKGVIEYCDQYDEPLSRAAPAERRTRARGAYLTCAIEFFWSQRTKRRGPSSNFGTWINIWGSSEGYALNPVSRRVNS